MNYEKLSGSIRAVIDRRPGDDGAYSDLFSLCREWETEDFSAAHMSGKRVQPKPRKKRMRKRTKFTILSIFNLTWYAVVVLILNACGHTVDTELTVGWFAAWTAELAILYGIKVKSKETSDEDAQG